MPIPLRYSYLLNNSLNYYMNDWSVNIFKKKWNLSDVLKSKVTRVHPSPRWLYTISVYVFIGQWPFNKSSIWYSLNTSHWNLRAIFVLHAVSIARNSVLNIYFLNSINFLRYFIFIVTHCVINNFLEKLFTKYVLRLSSFLALGISLRFRICRIRVYRTPVWLLFLERSIR